MRWEDERYVRVYTRDTVDWQMLSFDAQALFLLLLRKVDRAGLLALGKHGKRGVAVAVGHPREWERLGPALEELLADGCVRLTADGQCVLVPNFIAAQEATSSDKQRKAESRAKAREVAAAVPILANESQNVTHGHDPSAAVTHGHDASRSVTPSRAVPSRAEPSQTVPAYASQAPAVAVASGENVPDATQHAEEVPPRPPLVLAHAEPDATAAKSSRGPDPEALRELWNRLAPPRGLARWEAMNKARSTAARAALAEVPDLAKWEAWLACELDRPFNRGDNPSGWRADVDWLLRSKTRGQVADFNPTSVPRPAGAAIKPTAFKVL